MYAENALPLKTRARYTEHLADCQQCRQIVSQLSQAAGIVIVEKKKDSVKEQNKQGGFWASLFSPMVLKYALPVALLVTVASIGYFGLRESNKALMNAGSSTDQVARKDEATTPVPNEGLQNKSAAEPTTESAKSEPGATPSGSKSAEIRDDSDRGADANKQAKPNEARPSDQVAEKGRLFDAPPPAAPATARQEVASAPKPAEEQTVVTSETGGNRNQPAARATSDVSIAKSQAKENPSKDSGDEKKQDDSESDQRKAKTAARGQVNQAQNEREDAFRERGRQSQNNMTESRSVAGRHFYRENGVWVDSAYTSSQSMTRVSRGSEQFRALIADEPEIKRIADQLPGDVIVVWKSRVYRIQ